jgi:hypothetical protein
MVGVAVLVDASTWFSDGTLPPCVGRGDDVRDRGGGGGGPLVFTDGLISAS